jgi:gliding motility-associated-like protein
VQAKLAFPWALAVDRSGNVYIDDEGNWEIRKIDPSGMITDYGGNHLLGYAGDGGPAAAARISYPTSLACDVTGNLYLTDVFNYVVRKIMPCVAAPGTSDPAVTIATASAKVCGGEPVRFAATPVDGGVGPSYRWMVNGADVGVDSSLFVTDSLQDGDTVECLLTAPGSCQAPVLSNAVGMQVLPSPRVRVRPDTVIAYGQSVEMFSVVTGPVSSYQWTPAAGLSNAGIASPVATPVVTTVYVLTVGSGSGCSASDTVKVGVYRRVALPNAFTPNGDGRNDVFRIPPGIDLGLTRFLVFGRGGARVFETADVSQGWDGRLGGVAQPAGIYVWVLEYVDLLTGKSVKATGTVVLVR